MERRETLRREDLGNFLEVTVHFCHLSLAADDSTVLWTECQNGHCRNTKLTEQFSYLTLPAGDLLARREGKAKALCSGEAAKRCKVAGRCDCSPGMVTVGGGFQPVHLSCPRTGWLFRGAEAPWSGRLEGGSRWWDTSTSLKRSALRCGDSDQIQHRGFFFFNSFLLCFLHSFLPIFLPLFFPFGLFFLLPIYIHKVHILGLLGRCDRQPCLPHAGQQN